MRFRGSVHLLLAVAVLIGSLALYGCPKRPEVMQAAPAPAGPAAATVPGAGPAQPSPQTAETPARFCTTWTSLPPRVRHIAFSSQMVAPYSRNPSATPACSDF